MENDLHPCNVFGLRKSLPPAIKNLLNNSRVCVCDELFDTMHSRNLDGWYIVQLPFAYKAFNEVPPHLEKVDRGTMPSLS